MLMSQRLRILITVIAVIIALLAGNWVWNYYLYAPWTRDGKVRAEIITLSPDVSGWVAELSVGDNQQVRKGDPLFRIDDRRYLAALSQAEARLAYQQASYQLAQKRHEQAAQNDQEQTQLALQQAAANMAIRRAKKHKPGQNNLRWGEFMLSAAHGDAPARVDAPAKKAASKKKKK